MPQAGAITYDFPLAMSPQYISKWLYIGSLLLSSLYNQYHMSTMMMMMMIIIMKVSITKSGKRDKSPLKEKGGNLQSTAALSASSFQWEKDILRR